MPKILWLLTIIGLLTPLAFAADKTQEKLSTITTEIKSLQQGIAHDQDSQKNIENDLQATEVKMSRLSTSIAKLDTEMTQLRQDIISLNQQVMTLQNKLSQQQASLSEEMRNIYQLGQDSALKLILNTEAPDDLQRMMQYFRLLNQEKITKMTAIKNNLDHLEQLQQHLQQRQTQLSNIRLQEAELVHDMTQQQAQRQKLIAAIDDALTAKTDRLRTLQQNRQSLEGLVQQLQNQQPITTLPPFSFAKLQGRLPWPVAGSITDHFGSSIDESNLQWSGVLISTPTNTPVHAIYPGRVIFADWLKGFGLLVIIDHGQDYMSLYGRNDALLVKTGDNITFGQIIAKAGSTGGYSKSGLYFEIRHQGDPVNPEQWCQGQL